jgi:hypothetical protein
MKHLKVGMLLLFLSIASLHGSSSAQESAASLSVRGTWSGQWSNPAGVIYFAEVHLEAAGNGPVEGQIDWTLMKSARAQDQSKLGLTGVEFVKGKYDQASRVLTIDGYSKTDPNSILGLDKYRLIMAENGAALGGTTWNYGPWSGLFGLQRKAN